jgi:hypothetical protein
MWYSIRVMNGNTSNGQTYPSVSGQPSAPMGAAPSPTPTPAPGQEWRGQTTHPVVEKQRGSSAGLMIIWFLIGLILGGAAGYFAGYYFYFRPQLDEAQRIRTGLESQVKTLQQAQTGVIPTPNPTTPGTVTPGTGIAPTTGGITADPETASWSTFTSPEFKFSIKYPSDFEARTAQNSGDLEKFDDSDIVFALEIIKPGETEAAATVRVYSGAQDDGPSEADASRRWAGTLPVSITQKAAGAGKVVDVQTSSVTLNGTEGLELSGVEATAFGSFEPKPGGQTLTGYLFSEKFNRSYLVGSCSSDQTSQSNLVGCLALTTFTILP